MRKEPSAPLSGDKVVKAIKAAQGEDSKAGEMPKVNVPEKSSKGKEYTLEEIKGIIKLGILPMEKIEAEVFNCRPEQIAHSKDEVNKNTMAYVGELYPNIFNELPENIEHIYTSFPDHKVTLKEIKITNDWWGAKRLVEEMEKRGIFGEGRIQRSFYGELSELEKQSPHPQSGKKKLVFLHPDALGLVIKDRKPITKANYLEKAEKLGLREATSDIAAWLSLQYDDQHDQPKGEKLLFGIRGEDERASNAHPRFFTITNGPHLGFDADIMGGIPDGLLVFVRE